MPMSPKRPCTVPRCPQLQPCAAHPRHKRLAGQSYAERKVREPWAAWYDTAAWKHARRAYLAEHPLCVPCAKAGRDRLADTVDHIVPHRGDYAAFWRQANWQAMCASCHSRKTGSEVQARSGVERAK